MTFNIQPAINTINNDQENFDQIGTFVAGQDPSVLNFNPVINISTYSNRDGFIFIRDNRAEAMKEISSAGKRDLAWSTVGIEIQMITNSYSKLQFHSHSDQYIVSLNHDLISEITSSHMTILLSALEKCYRNDKIKKIVWPQKIEGVYAELGEMKQELIRKEENYNNLMNTCRKMKKEHQEIYSKAIEYFYALYPILLEHKQEVLINDFLDYKKERFRLKIHYNLTEEKIKRIDSIAEMKLFISEIDKAIKAGMGFNHIFSATVERMKHIVYGEQIELCGKLKILINLYNNNYSALLSNFPNEANDFKLYFESVLAINLNDIESNDGNIPKLIESLKEADHKFEEQLQIYDQNIEKMNGLIVRINQIRNKQQQEARFFSEKKRNSAGFTGIISKVSNLFRP